jgi:hypothetical protein
VMAFCQDNVSQFVDAPDGGRHDNDITEPEQGWCVYPNPTGGGSVCCISGSGGGVGGTFTMCVDYNHQVVAAYYNPMTPYPSSGGPCLGPTPSGDDLDNCTTTPPGYLITDFSTGDDCQLPGMCSPWCACQEQCTP